MKVRNKLKIIRPICYGCRDKICNTHALIDIIASFFVDIQQKKYSGLLCMDIKKVFDTKRHRRRLYKLQHYGVRADVYDLFVSVLASRQQYVSIYNYCSTPK